MTSLARWSALPPLTATHLAIGLVQGAALYALYRAGLDKVWPATDARVFAPALMVFVFVPVIALLVDLNGDGTDEVIVIANTAVNAPVFRLGPNGL